MVVNDCWSTPFIITFKHIQVYKSLISQITGKISADMPMYRKHEVREGKHTYGTYLFEGYCLHNLRRSLYSTWEDTGMFRFLEQAYLKSYKIRNKLNSS